MQVGSQKPTFSQLMETFNFFLKSNLSAEDNENTAVSEVRVVLGVLKYLLITNYYTLSYTTHDYSLCYD